MAQQLGRPTPEELARELRVVVKVGARASRLVYRLDQLPGLCQLTGRDPAAEKWDCAIAVVALVRHAVDELGGGPYGRAARMLVGVEGQGLGLPVGRRRSYAAEELQVQVDTFVRHWEPVIRLDVAIDLSYSTSTEL